MCALCVLLFNVSCISHYIIGIQRRAGFTPWWTRWHRGHLWHVSPTQEPHSAPPSWLTPSLTARCYANSCSVRRRLLVHVLVQLFSLFNSTVIDILIKTLDRQRWHRRLSSFSLLFLFPCPSPPLLCFRRSFPWPAPAVLPYWSHVSSASAPGHAAGTKCRAADTETCPGAAVDPSPSPPLPHPGRVLQVTIHFYHLFLQSPSLCALALVHLIYFLQ